MDNTLLKQLHERPIAYYPIYRKITGSTTAGILLSQLMYWFSKKDKLYKTDADIMAETLLTERELKTAKKKIKALPFIAVTLEGVPAKTYYEIDWELYQTSLAETSELCGPNSPNSDGQNVPTNSKNTTETTSEKRETTPTKKFIIPTVTEVAEYMNYLKIPDFLNEGAKFVDTYNTCGWVVGKTCKPMKDWKSAVSNWKRGIASFGGSPHTTKKSSVAATNSIATPTIANSTFDPSYSSTKEQLDSQGRMWSSLKDGFEGRNGGEG